MALHNNKSELRDYIKEKEKILKELYILDRLTSEELDKLKNVKNEIQADQIARNLINKYLED